MQAKIGSQARATHRLGECLPMPALPFRVGAPGDSEQLNQDVTGHESVPEFAGGAEPAEPQFLSPTK
jgi:hypothetical protein